MFLVVLQTPAWADPVTKQWQQEVLGVRWVAYFPTQANPNKNIDPPRESIITDLALLRQAGFTGLVTYGSSGIIGRELPALAGQQGFRGLIIGIWNPKDAAEMDAAKTVSKNKIVLGYCVGNEGLNVRYNLNQLQSAMEMLRTFTGKPVTTSEQIEHYDDVQVVHTGDWLFPTVHPYFHHELDPLDAVPWTEGAFRRLNRKTDKFVLFKEVGLPTSGSPNEKLSEENQKKYYLDLAKTSVHFVYFEAFDLPWKNHLPVEPHWGMFHADRSPKALALSLLAK